MPGTDQWKFIATLRELQFLVVGVALGAATALWLLVTLPPVAAFAFFCGLGGVFGVLAIVRGGG